MYKLPKSSHLEYQFLTQYKRLKNGHALPIAEYRFLTDRRFRFDFAWIEQKVSVEIEGGLYGKGRHTTVTGFNNDCEKYNLAVLNEWKVLRFTEKMLTNDPEGCVNAVLQLL